MTAAALVALFVAAVEAFSVMMAALMIFTVVMAAAFIPMMVSALLSFAVVMTAFVTFSVMMTVVVALGVGIIFQRSIRKGFCGSIRRSLNACIKLDPGVGKRRLRTHTDASADQGVSLHRLQEPGKGAVTASVGIHDLLIHDLPLFNIVQLKLLGMAEVLEDFSVFVCDCDPHGICSFLNDFLIDLDRFKFTVSACDQQPFSVYQGVGYLFPRTVINGGYGGPGDVHPGGAGFLGKTLVIQKSQCLKFIHGHLDAFCGCDIVRREAAIDRKLFDPAASEWSWHRLSFLTYVRKNNKPDSDICQ
jgi:hypothetical protein